MTAESDLEISKLATMGTARSTAERNPPEGRTSKVLSVPPFSLLQVKHLTTFLGRSSAPLEAEHGIPTKALKTLRAREKLLPLLTAAPLNSEAEL